MEERVERMRRVGGFEVVMEGTWMGAGEEGGGGGGGRGDCRFAFFDTEEKGVGVCVETICFGEGWREPVAVEVVEGGRMGGNGEGGRGE